MTTTQPTVPAILEVAPWTDEDREVFCRHTRSMTDPGSRERIRVYARNYLATQAREHLLMMDCARVWKLSRGLKGMRHEE